MSSQVVYLLLMNAVLALLVYIPASNIRGSPANFSHNHVRSREVQPADNPIKYPIQQYDTGYKIIATKDMHTCISGTAVQVYMHVSMYDSRHTYISFFCVCAIGRERGCRFRCVLRLKSCVRSFLSIISNLPDT